MISFYPGPSRVYDEIPKYVKEAHKAGILSMNHRSDEFMDLSKKTVNLLKKKLNVPKNYFIFFATSATECWEIIAQSLITKKSTHIFNGAFGQKWFQYTKRIIKDAEPFEFDKNEILNTDKLLFPESEIICITQNETSNGTQVTNEIIHNIQKNNPISLLAVDATSSMAGIYLNFKNADIWFASVQKCFGLPAGLSIMICSPRAIDKMKSFGENKHYNSLSFMKEMMDIWQTPCTPNVLGIYLLMRVLKDSDTIKAVHKKIIKRKNDWVSFLSSREKFEPLIQNSNVQSSTVICMKGHPREITNVKKKAKKAGVILGEGYGTLKSKTFRIANFPAIKEKEIKELKKILRDY
jgi:phosphoserine aminotransferase